MKDCSTPMVEIFCLHELIEQTDWVLSANMKVKDTKERAGISLTKEQDEQSLPWGMPECTGR